MNPREPPPHAPANSQRPVRGADGGPNAPKSVCVHSRFARLPQRHYSRGLLERTHAPPALCLVVSRPSALELSPQQTQASTRPGDGAPTRARSYAHLALRFAPNPADNAASAPIGRHGDRASAHDAGTRLLAGRPLPKAARRNTGLPTGRPRALDPYSYDAAQVTMEAGS